MSFTENQLYAFVAILSAAISICSLIYAGAKKLYCKGKDDHQNNDRITLLEQNHDKLINELETLKKWAQGEHEEMNQMVKDAFEKLDDKIDKMGKDVADIRGYIRGKSESKD